MKIKEIEDLAKTVKNQLQLKYDKGSVKYLEEFIERQKTRFSKEEVIGLINSCGAFLGQCIIENYGGQWAKDDTGNICISFGEKSKAYPFSKVSKQFENGLEDSIYSFYNVIPMVFESELTHRKKKKWWK